MLYIVDLLGFLDPSVCQFIGSHFKNRIFRVLIRVRCEETPFCWTWSLIGATWISRLFLTGGFRAFK